MLHGETDKARAIDYAPGEEMTFTLSLQGAEKFGAGEYFVQWTRTGDDGKTIRYAHCLGGMLIVSSECVRILSSDFEWREESEKAGQGQGAAPSDLTR